jgi:hypothetical protein
VADDPNLHIWGVCDEVRPDGHIQNIYKYYYPIQIEQRSLAGLSLELVTFAVLVYACWVDVGMDWLYYRTSRYPSVGLS